MSVDLFARIQPDSELHPQFLQVRDTFSQAPARTMLEQVARGMDDPDGNLAQQFQTHGFDARTFEIYLQAMLVDEGHAVDRTNRQPDFIVEKNGVRAAIEAVTANPTPDGTYKPYIPYHRSPRTREEAVEHLRNDVAMQFGSPLYTKLKKRYWLQPHIAGIPLILGVENFHEGALSISSTALSEYLFGIHHRSKIDPAGNLVVEADPAGMLTRGAKEMPSGFFDLEGAENVSAVLFSNAGTIAKFNRMGHQGPYRGDLRMLRSGTCYDWRPNAAAPGLFAYEVGDPAEGAEPWREGTVLIHNPRAVRPLPAEWLGAMAEENLENGTVVSLMRDVFQPYASRTTIMPGSTPNRLFDKEAERQIAALRGSIPGAR